MVDTYLDIQKQSHDNFPVPYTGILPQAAGQEAASARLVTVAAPASCSQKHTINILRLPEVMKRVGICRASIYQRMMIGSFPKQISLGARAVGWLEHEIDAWLAAIIAAQRGESV